VFAFTAVGGRIVEIDALADPARFVGWTCPGWLTDKSGRDCLVLGQAPGRSAGKLADN
jgi:hypothetical protein